LGFKFAWVVLLSLLAALVCGQSVGVVKEIDVNGNVRITREAILSNMTTKVGSPYNAANLDADRQTLLGLGFFSTVDINGVPIDNGNWRVLVQVQEFPTIKEIRVTGNTVISTDAIIKALAPQLRPGNIFDPRYQVSSSNGIEKLYADKGYFARVLTLAPLPTSPQTLDVEIVENRVGTISIQGNKLTKDWVMKRLVKLRSGDLESTRAIQRDTRRMLNTGWFESARFVEDPQNELGKVDLTIDVKEQQSGTFNVGLQVDPQSSFAGVIRLAEANLWGTGQSVGLDFVQGTTAGGPSVSLNYANPFIDHHDTTFNASIYSRILYRFSGNLFGGGSGLLNSSQYDERHTGVSVGLARPISDTVSVSSAVRLEQVTTQDLNNLFNSEQTPNDPTDDQTTNNFIQQDGQSAILSLALTRNRRDIDIDPSRGDFFQLTLEPGYSNVTHVGGLTSGTDILGPHYFTKASADYRVYWTWEKPRGLDLNAPRKVVAFRVRYSTVAGTIPFYEQYFAGGADTLRGYQDSRFWGKQLLLTNLELRYPVQKAFSLIGFIDCGGAWGGYGTIQGFSQSNNLSLHLGYGPGVSFRTPLGNIQLFYGFNSQGGSQPHFLIGNSF
jgi:outer membrane protein insertion porin family